MAYTTAKLLSQIERRSFVPANQSTFSAAEILTMAHEELTSFIFPEIIKSREEYFIWYNDSAITANQSGYDVPVRSFNSTLREIKKLVGTSLVNLTKSEIEDLESTQTGVPSKFYFKGDKVHLYPTPNSTVNTLRQYFVLTPGEYIETDSNVDYAVVSAIDTDTNVVSVTAIPSSWTTGDIFDFLRKDGDHSYRGIDCTSTLVSGTDITFPLLPSNLAVGDYICPQGYSSLVQLPNAFRPVLAQLAAAALLESAGQPGADEARKKGMAMLEKAVDNINPRIIGENKYITHNWF